MTRTLRKRPPLPKWHGMPPDLVDQYLAFVRRYQAKSVAERIRRLDVRIQEIGYSRSDAMDSIKSYRREVAESVESVAQCERKLAELSDVSMYEEGLLELMYEPSLLGIRVNSAGRLVLHLRAHKQEDGEFRYVGDFEFNLDNLMGHYLYFIQTDISTERHIATQADRLVDTKEGVIQSSLYESPRSYRELLRQGDFVGLANALVERVCRAARSKYRLQLDTAESEPVWRGIAPEIARALDRTLDLLVRAEAKDALAQAQRDLSDYKVRLKRSTDELRALNGELAEKRAELKKLQASVDNLEFDEEAAKKELYYMTSLPGVMGVRFENVDGKGLVPVVHVRTTMVYNGQRYDLGDYELVFYRHHGESAAVIETRQTRKARSAGMYYHTGPYDYRCGCCRYRTWFCFGNRAAELTELFELGSFSAFLHLAINSLNSINESELSYYDLGSYFVKIDDDAVWMPRTVTARRRPRRRWIAEAVSAIL
jgi:hypothetical protein